MEEIIENKKEKKPWKKQITSDWLACLDIKEDKYFTIGEVSSFCFGVKPHVLRYWESQFKTLTPAQQKDIDNTLRDFRLSGVALPEAQKAQYMENVKRLSELTTRFENNLLDATQAWKKHVTDEAELAGLPDTALAGAADRARAEGLEQGWLLTLDFPVFFAVMSHAENRALREEMYRAFTTRASDQGPQAGEYDNGAVMDEILKLRHEQASAGADES